MKPPLAQQVPFEITTHGHTRTDPYYWLNQRNNQEVVDYLTAENNYTDTMLSPVKGLIEDLFNEMTARIKKDDETVPYLKNGYYYQTRYQGEGEYPIYLRWEAGDEADKEVLFDMNKMAEGHPFFSDSYHHISPDNKIAAVGIDTVSRRNYTLKFKDLVKGTFLPDEIPLTTGSVAWGADNQTIFYALRDQQTLRAHKIMRHILGTDPDSDVQVFEEEDETFSVSVYNSKSNHHIIIFSGSTLTSEARIVHSKDPRGEFVVVEPRERGHEYSVYATPDKLYIRTNLNAQNFKVVVTELTKPCKENWKDVIPYRPDVLVEDLEVFAGYIVISERFQGLGRFNVVDLKTSQTHQIMMEEESYVLGASVNSEFATDDFRFVYSSLTTPRSVYDYDMKRMTRTLRKETEVLGGFNKRNYETKRLLVTADDGVQIPVTMVYRKGIRKDGQNPALIYGYGSYGYSMEPWFRTSILSLLDRGFIYAIAHVRGGEEMGRTWYEEGKLMKKMNTFTDFIACSEYLIREQYTSPEKFFAMGGSAGGLLMGVVSNMRPDLFNGILAAVPFVDVVTTMLDESIPLTTGEYDEWGNPKEKACYDYMLAYSPYDQVARKDYCNMLITSGFHDSQVQYWEPAKWTAKLRTHQTSDKLILMHTNMEVGHGGASGRFSAYREIAMEYAFMLMLLD
jgi:oligopeptidase B